MAFHLSSTAALSLGPIRVLAALPRPPVELDTRMEDAKAFVRCLNV